MTLGAAVGTRVANPAQRQDGDHTTDRRSTTAWTVALVLLPLVAFALPALLGHPILLGDDADQNFPLRVLVGAELRAGHLPLFDPYLWSGSPLLSGWNAAAAFPLTWLFAVLPGVAAWTAGLVVTWWVAGLSMLAFLRALGLRVTAAGIGALMFVGSGTMAAQIVHVGLVQGMAFVPLQLLAVERIAAAPRRRSAWRWAAVLAVAGALTILAAEPRAISDAVVIVAIFAFWRVLSAGDRRSVALGLVAIGVVCAVALGALQWVPGMHSVATSQRGATSAAFFSSGSLPVRWLDLLAVPDLLGSSGSFGLPSFLPSYNLTEVSGYVGIFGLVGAFGMLGQTLGRWRLRHRPPDFLVWHLIALVGVVLTLGGNTPLGHLLVHLPLYGAQRLQSRNLAIVDVALCVLAAYFADWWLDARPEERVLPRERATKWLGITGALIPVGLALAAWRGEPIVRTALGLPPAATAVAGRLWPALLASVGLGVVVALLVAVAGLLRPRAARGWLKSVVAADVVFFLVLAVVAVAPGFGSTPVPASRTASTAPAPPPTRSVASLHIDGRFAIYDPNLLHGDALIALGAPDRNILTRTPSVLGYGSLVNAEYAAVTGAHGLFGHGQDVFAPSAASGTAFDSLDTTALFTVPAALVTPHATPELTRVVGAGTTTTYALGTPASLSALTVSGSVLEGTPGLSVTLETAAGQHVLEGAGPAGRPLTLSVPVTEPIVTLVVTVTGPGRVALAPPAFVTAGGARLYANGPLENALQPPHWTYRGQDGPFAFFHNTRAAPPVRLATLNGQSLAGASVHALSGPASAPDKVAVVAPKGALLVRSVAAIPGWRASFTPAGGGTPVPLAVRRDGLVQEVALPAGLGVVTFSYAPPGLTLGLALSAGGLVGLLALVVLGRRRRVAAEPGEADGDV